MRLSLLVFKFLTVTAVFAQNWETTYKELPIAPAWTTQEAKKDFLIDPSVFKAGVFRSHDGKELLLSNGLITRTFRLSPNVATVGLKNLSNEEEMLRGVKPEAKVILEDIPLEVGGMTGQTNYAYLLHEEKGNLRYKPNSMLLQSLSVGSIQPRMKWKQVRRHAPNTEWPPKGVQLSMTYLLPELTTGFFIKHAAESSTGRELLVKESFNSLSLSNWKVRNSPLHSRSSFSNEGKQGEIYTPQNTAVYAERSLPARTALVEATIYAGTDKSTTHAPGLTVEFEKKTISFFILAGGVRKGGKPALGVFDGVHLRQPLTPRGNRLDFSKEWKLRIKINQDTLLFEACPVGKKWKRYHRAVISGGLGTPRKIRVGKNNTIGKSQDAAPAQAGEPVRLHVHDFAAYGAVEATKVEQLKKRLRRFSQVEVTVHYALYDGIPAYSKWLTIHNKSEEKMFLNNFSSEYLAAVEHSSVVDKRTFSPPMPPPNIHAETDYVFGGMSYHNTSPRTIHWETDPDYLTQVNYLRETPCLLNISPDKGVNTYLNPNETFTTFRAFVLLNDSYDRLRKGLALKRMYRTVAPWITENPLMMHVRYADWETVRNAIDQCAAVGFEMVILTFGSGFNIENEKPAYLQKMKKYADYAQSKGIEIGGYSLLASRHINDNTDVINPQTGKPGGFATFGNSPCLGSKWGQDYFRKLYQFYEKTGWKLLEHDGSYPGDVCASLLHPGHRGLKDSQYKQWKQISEFYQWCRGQGIYLNIPDYYYLTGSNKCGMGYRETNWSLPRAQQLIHTRQNIFDGSWQKTPSMGWMFVPLTQYHGGGEAATIEPLHEHLDHYHNMMISNLGMGVQACYRGPRIYDTPKTREMLSETIAWYKKYRDILESDMVPLRRADGKDLDYMLHVNPTLQEKGMLLVFNPTRKPIEKTLTIPLYYTGLKNEATVQEKGGKQQTLKLNREYKISLNVSIPSGRYTWFVIK